MYVYSQQLIEHSLSNAYRKHTFPQTVCTAHTKVTGLPGNNDSVGVGVWLRHKLNFHIVWCLNIVLTDLQVFFSYQFKAWPWNTTWEETKQYFRDFDFIMIKY